MYLTICMLGGSCYTIFKVTHDLLVVVTIFEISSPECSVLSDDIVVPASWYNTSVMIRNKSLQKLVKLELNPRRILPKHPCPRPEPQYKSYYR